MSAKIKLKKTKDYPIIAIIGDITAEDSNTLSIKLDALAKKKYTKIVIDLSETNYIDSHGLGVFVYMWKVLVAMDKHLIFLNPTGFIKEMFHETNLDQVLPIVDKLEDV